MVRESGSKLDVERLDRCLAQLNSGEADLETLLARPEPVEGQADELRTLLRVAALVRATPQPTPSPEAKEEGRRRLVRAAMERRRRQAAPAPSFRGVLERVAAAWQSLVQPRPALRRATVLIVALVMVLALTSAGVTRAAATSLPDSPLYPVKLATEKIQLILTPSMVGKARLHIAFGERRLWETQALAEKGQGVDERVLQAMLDHTTSALEAIAQLPAEEREPLLGDFASLAEKEWMILKELKERIPPADHPPVDEAITISAQNQELAEEAQENPELLPMPSPTSTATLTVAKPTLTPTVAKPTATPKEPTSTPKPTATPQPTEVKIISLPTVEPTVTPTPEPTEPPTTPTVAPTETPTAAPTATTEPVGMTPVPSEPSPTPEPPTPEPTPTPQPPEPSPTPTEPVEIPPIPPTPAP